MEDRRKSMTTGDVLHLVQIAVVLIAMGIGYEKFQVSAEQASRNNDKLERIEHYLSSKDPEYWRLSRDQ